MPLTGKIALVTGASRGIGCAVALALSRLGAIVVGTATTAAGAEKISENFAAAKLQGQGMLLDVANPDNINVVIGAVQAQYDSLPTILVNNAAITRDNLMLRMKDEEWHMVLETNLNSVFRITKACLKGMLKARWGRVINIGSVVGTTGNIGQVNYATAKAGILGFTKSLAQELGSRNITVNTVAPGFIDTDMTRHLADEHRQLLLSRIPLQRLGMPEEIAEAVVFLASDKAAYITGQTLHVNGGMFME